jgi:feruloyl esterase
MISRIQIPTLALALLSPLCTLAAECVPNTFDLLAAKSPYGVTVTDAKAIDEAGGYCQVEGEIANAENGQSQIKFRLRLPEAAAWNGKFLMLGNGGTAGVFQGEERVQVALELGFATAQTDTGHTRAGPDDWIMKELEPGFLVPNYVAIDDFGHRSIHLTTEVGKSFVDTFYARAPEFSYYFGCSTGGRQGMRAIQQYPSDFDGLVVGAPVYSLTRLNMSQVWVAQQVAELDAKGESLSAAQLDLVKEGALSQCDAADGLADRVIDNPLQCGFEPKSLLCPASGSSSQCLSSTQVDFVSSIYAGPVTETGEQMYPGRVRGSEGSGGMSGMGGWRDLLPADCPNEAGTSRCDLVARAWHQDPDKNMRIEFSIDNPDDVAAADSSYYSAATRADNPDVTPFVQGGGKALLFHGFSDTSVTPIATIQLYEAMEDTVSRKRGSSDFREHLRLFLAPGMGHCGGGEGPNNYIKSTIEALDLWVTTDQAPDAVIATHEQRGISRPWCPYPQVARLREPNLNSNNAESFHCVNPAE